MRLPCWLSTFECLGVGLKVGTCDHEVAAVLMYAVAAPASCAGALLSVAAAAA